jgi:type I restriction enzyme S subunit
MGNTPNVRFKGFTEDWEQRKVTDLGEIYIGLVTTMTEHYTDSGHLLIRNSDIKDGYFEFGENPIYLDEEFSEQNKSRMHQLGDVITVHTGDIGTSAVIGENEVNSIGFATIVTRPNQEKLDSNYFATYLNTDTHKQWAISMATGDGRSNYNLKDYTKLVVPIPEIEEQKKIAACIGNLNNLITLHQQKCDETKELKKYMLQNMFPQKDEKVPKIRFAGFTGDWKQRKLGEVAEFNPKSELPEVFEYVDLESVVGTEMVSHRTEIKDSAPSRAQRLAQVGDVFYQTVRPYQKNNYLFEKPDNNYVFSTGYAQLRPFIDARFLMSYLQTEDFVKVVMDNCTGTSYPAINSSDLANIKISLSNNSTEQQQIGTYFSNLGNLITLHQQKCNALKEFKKYMLQNMFPQKGENKCQN